VNTAPNLQQQHHHGGQQRPWDGKSTTTLPLLRNSNQVQIVSERKERVSMIRTSRQATWSRESRHTYPTAHRQPSTTKHANLS
ncbi:MAG: hypothetical protein ACK56I_14240, partial [bacterium]